MRRRGALAAYAAMLAALLVIAAPASGASKNVELLDNLPEAKDATAINFMSYGKHESDAMLVTGRFGLKSYSLEDPRHPSCSTRSRRRSCGFRATRPSTRTEAVRADLDVLAERGHGPRPEPQARAALT